MDRYKGKLVSILYQADLPVSALLRLLRVYLAVSTRFEFLVGCFVLPREVVRTSMVKNLLHSF